MSESDPDFIEITMTETVEYVAEYSVEELAVLVGLPGDSTYEEVMAALPAATDAEPSLLDDMIERHLDHVSERKWSY